MKKILVISLTVFLITACKQCDDPTGLPMKFSSFVEDKWECKNHVALEHDVETWFASKNLCQKPPNYYGSVANLVCPLIGAALRFYMVSKVPISWECNPALIGNDAASGIVALCELVPW